MKFISFNIIYNGLNRSVWNNWLIINRNWGSNIYSSKIRDNPKINRIINLLK